MLQKYSYAFIEGDHRQIYLMERFASEGALCISYGLPKAVNPHIRYAASLEEAVKNSKNILCPIPFTQNNTIDPEELTAYLSKGQTLYGGCLPHQLVEDLDAKNITCYDYMQSEELTIFNTIATAEGIIAEAIIKYPYNLHKAKCLIMGYGRCGRTLADKLKGLQSDVTICTRQRLSHILVDSLGYRSIYPSELAECIADYDLIFNTVPELVLNLPILEKMTRDQYIFDIASLPGGVDLKTAQRLNLHTGLYPGLPGKYSPQASADALYEFILGTI